MMVPRLILLTMVTALWAAQALCAVPEGVLLKDGKPASYMWVRNDGGGCRWDVDSSGGIADGTNDAYDGAMYTSVNNNSVSAGPLVQDPSGRECQIGPATYSSGIQAWRRIYVPEKESYCRIIDIYYNPGRRPDVGHSDTFEPGRRGGGLGAGQFRRCSRGRRTGPWPPPTKAAAATGRAWYTSMPRPTVACGRRSAAPPATIRRTTASSCLCRPARRWCCASSRYRSARPATWPRR